MFFWGVGLVWDFCFFNIWFEGFGLVLSGLMSTFYSFFHTLEFSGQVCQVFVLAFHSSKAA